jgi:hypothetical protein
MSGGDYSGVGSGGAGENRDCTAIFDRTVLNSPQQEVLETLESGDVLTLRIEELGNGRMAVVAVTEDGDIAGSITSATVAKLKVCLESGFKFIAIVESIENGKCVVNIRPEGATL